MPQIMILIDENHPELKEWANKTHVGIYTYNQLKDDFLNYNILAKEWSSFEENQKDYNCVYSTNPQFLLNKKIKIPYFYNIYSNIFDNEMDFKEFNNYYSQLAGANAVFVNERTLNKYSSWLELNSYWVNSAINSYDYIPKKFFTPKLHIGYVYNGNNDVYDLVKKIISIKKSNWIFHIYEGNRHDISAEFTENVVFYDGENFEKRIFENTHVLLDIIDPRYPKEFPSDLAARAMSGGVVLISNNSHNNNSNIFFDKTHYFKLDFNSANDVADILRYCDKRREKLERVSISGKDVVNKYFSNKVIVSEKLRIIKNFI